MRKPAITKIMATAGAMLLVVGSLSLLPQVTNAAESSMVAEGKKIAFNRKKGNCLACHKIKGGALEGNIGPELVNMKMRYPDKKKLRDQIWDPTRNNPNTMMPPFGKFKILSEQEIDKIVEFVSSL